MATVLAAAVALPLALPAASLAAEQCQAQVDAALQKHAISASDVKSMKVTARSRGGKAANNFRLDAWVRLNSCSGYVMVNMTRGCLVQQSYTTGDCKIEGLPSY